MLDTRRSLAVVVTAAALALGGCTTSAAPAPSAAPTSGDGDVAVAATSPAGPDPDGTSPDDPIVGAVADDAPPLQVSSCGAVTAEEVSAAVGFSVDPASFDTSAGGAAFCTWSETAGPRTVVASFVPLQQYGVTNYAGECPPWADPREAPSTPTVVQVTDGRAVSGLGREARWCAFLGRVTWRTGGSLVSVGGVDVDDRSQLPRASVEDVARLVYASFDAGDPPGIAAVRKAVPAPGSSPNATAPPGCDRITVDEASELLDSVIGVVKDDGGTCSYDLGDPASAARTLVVGEDCTQAGADPRSVYPGAEDVPDLPGAFVANLGFGAMGMGPVQGSCRSTVMVVAGDGSAEVAQDALRLLASR